MNNPSIIDDDGGRRELPFFWAICGQCQGEGKSSAYLGAFTSERMDEAGPEFREDYISSAYDRTCETCGGSGKVKVVDQKRMTRADAATYTEQQQDEAEARAVERQERLFEGGWREEGWR